jgi:hypothetical protein
MSIWDRNGWITVEVTQQDIDDAMERNSSHCAVAMAIARIEGVKRISVDLQTVRFSFRNLRYCCLTPHVAQDAIVAFDQGERAKLVPFVMRMRPAVISRAGKRRRECPTNQELRGTGLTVAAEQLHLSERLTVEGERNLDPNRSDGLALPPPQRTRTPRRKVSTAAKGSIPTTLGGTLPPVSILSRREFGLRQLRR